jgi:arsenical pump membrane protein
LLAVVALAFGLFALVAIVSWRPHGWGPTLGAAIAVGVGLAVDQIQLADFATALREQWRAFLTLGSVMVMTSSAERMGWFTHLASIIERYARGPVRSAFRMTFILAAAMSALLSNDAAILVLTPTVIALLRTVYPKRNPKFLVPFAVAVFAAAGVAPFLISNPMNLIFADHVGIGFNQYLITMVPIALIGWTCTYAVLAYLFRDVLTDQAPALGAWPTLPSKPRGARVVLVALVMSSLAYPAMSALGAPLWPVAVTAAFACVAACAGSGQSVRSVLAKVTWTIFPFLVGVFLLALALQRVGAVAWLQTVYAGSPSSLAVVGTTSAIGSALMNNHPMSMLNAFALEHATSSSSHFAALIGGDLGPRLLPVGSLASLLWFDALTKAGVAVSVRRFVVVGLYLTIPTLIVSLMALKIISAL